MHTTFTEVDVLFVLIVAAVGLAAILIRQCQ
jgi:hypothetical protein